MSGLYNDGFAGDLSRAVSEKLASYRGSGSDVEESRLLNQVLFEKLTSTDPRYVKQANDAINDFTRTKIREDGVMRRVFPPIPISDSDLDRQVGSSMPVKIIDREPDSPAAVMVPFATLPSNLYIKADRYPVHFARIETTKFTVDVDELRTYHMDVRQVLSDNSIKDMLAEEDSKFLNAVDRAIVGPEAVVPTSGVVQYRQLYGDISRATLWESMNVLPSTPSNLETHCVLLNSLTVNKVAKMSRNELGGDLAEQMMRNGASLGDFMGRKWVVTIKKALVPTNTMYHFADPKFIGKSFILEEPTTFIERKAFFIEYFTYELIGCAIGNTSGVGRVDFL